MSKAKARLKEFASFSPNIETFKQLFWENLDKNRTEVAIDVLLDTVYEMLTSHGEEFEELLLSVDESSRLKLESWLSSQRKEKR